jgi:hypothetical protein
MTLVWSPDYLGSPGKIVLSNPLTCTNTAKGDNKLYSDAKGVVPSLDLRFAEGKNLNDYMTGQNLITFSRSSIGTYVDENGIIQTATADTPRFDHDPTTGESLGLLIEESRTNLINYSQDFNFWNALSTQTLQENAAVSPSGANDATKAIPSTVFESKTLLKNVSPNATNVCSIYVKAAGYTNFQARELGAARWYVNFNLSTSTYVGGGADLISAEITPVGNGWYRCSVVNSTANVAYSIAGYPDGYDPGSAPPKFVGDGTSGIYIWGAQIEEGSFPTSYIPTTGTALTRSADVASISGSDFSNWYNQGEGTVFSETKGKVTSGGGRDVVDISDGSGSGNRILLRDHQFFITNSTVIQVNIGFTDTLNNTKTAAAFTLNDAVIYSDGVNKGTDTSLTLPTVDRIHIGSYNGGGEQLCGCISRLTYFPERLPDSTLQTITTP